MLKSGHAAETRDCRQQEKKFHKNKILLNETMSLTSSTMTRMLDNLTKDKLIERGEDPNDRRVVVVKLTNKGKKLTRDIEEFKDKYFSVLRRPD